MTILSHPTLARVGHISGRVLYDVNTQVDREFYFNAYCVSLEREDGASLEFNLVGQAIPYQANPSKCFIGVPSLVAIDENGQVTNSKITQDIGASCGTAVLDFINAMPKWKSGKQRGKNVKVAYSLKVDFRLANEHCFFTHKKTTGMLAVVNES